MRPFRLALALLLCSLAFNPVRAQQLNSTSASNGPPTSISQQNSPTGTATAPGARGIRAPQSGGVTVPTEFKVQSWIVGPQGNAASPSGKCLDYGVSPSNNGATVFLNDCSKAHPIRVVELPPQRVAADGTPRNHEIMLFAGGSVIGVHHPLSNTFGNAPAPTATEFGLDLQRPWNSLHGAASSNPANQIFAYDGDSIILESSRPCVNSDLSKKVCPAPPPQLVIQIQNARGANGSPLVAGVRNLADHEFWDFVPVRGFGFPTKGFTVTPIDTNAKLWNAICSSPTADQILTNPLTSPCTKLNPNIGWNSVIVVTGSDPNECEPGADAGTDPNYFDDPSKDPGVDPGVGPCIDLTFFPPIVLPPGVTIRGNRRGLNLGPQLYSRSQQEHIFENVPVPPCEVCVVDVHGDYVRVTGLRMRGPSRDTHKGKEEVTDGISISFPGNGPVPGSGAAPPLFPVTTLTEFIATIDHNDMSDWGDAAISGAPSPYTVLDGDNCKYPNATASGKPADRLYPCGRTVPDPSTGLSLSIIDEAGTLANVRIARNFLHNNEKDGFGYGANVSRALLDANTFAWNRHDITAAGEPHNEYRAINNLVLSGAPHYYIVSVRLQDFDMHGTHHPTLWVDGVGGYFVEIAGNTFLGQDGHDYAIRGSPVLNTFYHDNVSLRSESSALRYFYIGGNFANHEIPSSNDYTGTPFPIIISNSQFAPSISVGISPTTGDFDGDGDDDLFLATGAAWYYSPAGKREWRFLSAKKERTDQVLLGDFDGDGRTDVVAIHDGKLVVSWGGVSDWEPFNSNSVLSCTALDMAAGKFLSHSVGDQRDDIFCADGSTWYLSYGGSGPFNYAVNRPEKTRRWELRFADFNGDGLTDVFGVGSNGWQVSNARADKPLFSDWKPLSWSLTSTITGLYVVKDFFSPGAAAVAKVCDSDHGSWCVAGIGTDWTPFKLQSDLLSGAVIGYFHRRAGANGQPMSPDILFWNGYPNNEFAISQGGTSPTVTWSTQDMK